MFGHDLAWVDFDGNGNDELVIGEPFNGSAYQSGKIWIFNGTPSGLELPDPLTTISSTLANDQFGSVFESAGDVNEDGYEDILISHRGVGKIGSLSLYLGSQFGILTTPQTLAQGSEQGDMVAATISTGGDYDDDGMSEIIVLEFENITINGDGWVNLLTERDWATTSLGYGGISISDIEIGSSFSGVMNILIESASAEPPLLLQHMDDGTPEGRWLERSFESVNSPSMVTLVSGAVVLFAHDDDDAITLLSHSSRQLVEQTTITTGNIGAWVDIEIDGLNHPSMMHARVDTSEIYWTRASSGGWSTSLVIGSVDLDAPITHLIDDDNKKWVVYRDSTDASLNAIHRPLNSWNSNILVSNGLALSDEHAAVLLTNDSLAVLS
ncbi:MAG: integrin alpha, partial [Candidatus Poseidoniaceae archaeon]|nr:integrin alpha [Candidatus Poseidoniaceae archaeon]